MKRITALILAILCLPTVAACGSDGNTASDSSYMQIDSSAVTETAPLSQESEEPPPEFILPTLDNVTEIMVERYDGGIGFTEFTYTEPEQIDAFLSTMLDSTPIYKERVNATPINKTVNGGVKQHIITLRLSDGSEVTYKYIEGNLFEYHGASYYLCPLAPLAIEKLITDFS